VTLCGVRKDPWKSPLVCVSESGRARFSAFWSCFCESAPATHVGQAECGPVADAPFRRSESLDTVEPGFLVGEQLNIACHLDCCGLDRLLEY
jgi:hypothetical protein